MTNNERTHTLHDVDSTIRVMKITCSSFPQAMPKLPVLPLNLCPFCFASLESTIEAFHENEAFWNTTFPGSDN